ncbi:MAG: HAD-IC family P-type ATPase, partial [Lachnospiraceae bacterium]|nr:HAD-IC family P-type ATPase [Lachnospiraceae bacterium]
EVAAYGEGMSNHPIALSIREAYGKPLALELLEQIKEIPGIGILGYYQGQEIQVGNVRLLGEGHADLNGSAAEYTTVYVLKEKKHMGTIYIADELKPTSKQMIKELKELGINHTVMLTGDREQVAQAVGTNLGLDQIYAELLPQDKLTKTEEILAQKGDKESVAFVGDGMNDAPVLARVDVGIAMGSLGSDAAIEAADVVLMDDDPIKIGTAIRISRKTMKIVKQNIILALGVKFCVMILGVIGVANMWEAVFADVGVSVLAIMNAMRTLRFRR